MRQAVAARRALSESVLAELRPSYPLLDQYKDWAVVNTEKVQWGDLDAFNHVNNCVFLRYFENARFQMIEEMSKEYDAGWSEGKGASVIMADNYVRYRSPLYHPDEIATVVRAEDAREADMYIAFKILSKQQNKVVAEGRGRLVSFDYGKGCKVPFPTAVLDAIRNMQGSDFEVSTEQ
ncbi:uncharacterized protein MONBRDRAFT_30452 [Monosiga brevicollis MX1]|uniref:Thioesterase domain-containing protein n=1 Tax=Monosiga brevicollis TaxID=81824 RepID=A9VE01_MONBE|nr:uncharacterized protein MONBRDRAFT_30452 [Monosiga brevicollis MX1]EDQ84219.1 predicted protein [Monosiga brevicollis MX1]|eukprot:XP_001750943.1 hypothetical protein [Monosiga brevicollis MX1]